jgi:transposase-like protein
LSGEPTLEFPLLELSTREGGDDEVERLCGRWAAIVSIAAKIGCTGQTLNEWLKKAERDSGRTPGLTTEMAAKLKALERENRELRQANKILRKASAYFAQAELDRRYKP